MTKNIIFIKYDPSFQQNTNSEPHLMAWLSKLFFEDQKEIQLVITYTSPDQEKAVGELSSRLNQSLNSFNPSYSYKVNKQMVTSTSEPGSSLINYGYNSNLFSNELNETINCYIISNNAQEQEACITLLQKEATSPNDSIKFYAVNISLLFDEASFIQQALPLPANAKEPSSLSSLTRDQTKSNSTKKKKKPNVAWIAPPAGEEASIADALQTPAIQKQSQDYKINSDSPRRQPISHSEENPFTGADNNDNRGTPVAPATKPAVDPPLSTVTPSLPVRNTPEKTDINLAASRSPSPSSMQNPPSDTANQLTDLVPNLPSNTPPIPSNKPLTPPPTEPETRKMEEGTTPSSPKEENSPPNNAKHRRVTHKTIALVYLDEIKSNNASLDNLITGLRSLHSDYNEFEIIYLINDVTTFNTSQQKQSETQQLMTVHGTGEVDALIEESNAKIGQVLKVAPSSMATDKTSTISSSKIVIKRSSFISSIAYIQLISDKQAEHYGEGLKFSLIIGADSNAHQPLKTLFQNNDNLNKIPSQFSIHILDLSNSAVLFQLNENTFHGTKPEFTEIPIDQAQGGEKSLPSSRNSGDTKSPIFSTSIIPQPLRDMSSNVIALGGSLLKGTSPILSGVAQIFITKPTRLIEASSEAQQILAAITPLITTNSGFLSSSNNFLKIAQSFRSNIIKFIESPASKKPVPSSGFMGILFNAQESNLTSEWNTLLEFYDEKIAPFNNENNAVANFISRLIIYINAKKLTEGEMFQLLSHAIVRIIADTAPSDKNTMDALVKKQQSLMQNRASSTTGATNKSNVDLLKLAQQNSQDAGLELYNESRKIGKIFQLNGEQLNPDPTCSTTNEYTEEDLNKVRALFQYLLIHQDILIKRVGTILLNSGITPSDKEAFSARVKSLVFIHALNELRLANGFNLIQAKSNNFIKLLINYTLQLECNTSRIFNEDGATLVLSMKAEQFGYNDMPVRAKSIELFVFHQLQNEYNKISSSLKTQTNLQVQEEVEQLFTQFRLLKSCPPTISRDNTLKLNTGSTNIDTDITAIIKKSQLLRLRIGGENNYQASIEQLKQEEIQLIQARENAPHAQTPGNRAFVPN